MSLERYDLRNLHLRGLMEKKIKNEIPGFSNKKQASAAAHKTIQRLELLQRMPPRWDFSIFGSRAGEFTVGIQDAESAWYIKVWPGQFLVSFGYDPIKEVSCTGKDLEELIRVVQLEARVALEEVCWNVLAHLDSFDDLPMKCKVVK